LTIATPFYGTSTQQERYFIGVSQLNPIYGATTAVRVVSSLPGPYTLMFLPKEIYDRDAQKLGLSRFPEYDPESNADIDPYDPSIMRRWRPGVRDHRRMLLQAKAELIEVAKPIDAAIEPVFFH